MSELNGLELMPEAMKIRKIKEQELEIASLKGRIVEAISEFGELQATADRRGKLVDVVNKYRKSRLITDRKAMFELAKELNKS